MNSNLKRSRWDNESDEENDKEKEEAEKLKKIQKKLAEKEKKLQEAEKSKSQPANDKPAFGAATNGNIIQVEKKFFQFGFYTGEWSVETNKPHGKGKWYKGEVLQYDGGWSHGQWMGHGTVYNEEGIRLCDGEYFEGELHGFGVLYAEDGETIEDQSFHVFGEERPDILSREDFEQATKKAEEERERQKSRSLPQLSTNRGSTTTTVFSATLNANSPIMSAPIIGLFPRYERIPHKMLEGAGFQELEDDEIPTPTNLEEGKTREDWLLWVRKFYPKKV